MKNNLIRIAGDASAALYEIERCMLGWRDRQMVIDDVTVIGSDRASIEFSVDWGKLTFSWWDGERAECWRVIEYSIQPGEVRLLAVRGMGAEKCFFRIRSPEVLRAQPSAATVEADEMRGRYRALLGSLIAEACPGARIERSTGGRTQTPEGMSVPSPYARLVVRLRRETALVIGAQSEESKQTVDDIIAAGIVWLRGHNLGRSRNPASRLVYCLPRGRSATALERLALIDSKKSGAGIEVFEVDETVPEIVPVRPLAQYELLDLRPRNLEWPGPAPLNTPWHEALTGPAPDLIEVRVKPFTRRISYSINGLEFASVGGEGECRFGVAGATDRQYLTGRNLHLLEALITEILDRRRAGTPDPRHPFYRLRTEAWLESRIRRDISRLDASLDERFVYSQIPAWRGDERSVIDLLSITLDGRLAVIEIKAAEDFHLPLQGLDYWLRIEQSRAGGELRRRKLFSGVEPADASPLLFLVAPALRFHRSFRLVAGCLDPDIEAFQIGINSSWRDEIRVRTRTRVNGD